MRSDNLSNKCFLTLATQNILQDRLVGVIELEARGADGMLPIVIDVKSGASIATLDPLDKVVNWGINNYSVITTLSVSANGDKAVISSVKDANGEGILVYDLPTQSDSSNH